MSKYIIKNCPAILKCKYGNYCIELENTEYTKQLCEDFPDCLLKQIVEKCEHKINACKRCKDQDCYGCAVGMVEIDILDLLDISEVE